MDLAVFLHQLTVWLVYLEILEAGARENGAKQDRFVSRPEDKAPCGTVNS
jgi:hypothetical protein